MKRKKNQIFSKNLTAFLFVCQEAFLVFLIIFQFFWLLGIKRSGYTLTFFNNYILPQNILWFIATIILLIVIYFGIALRDKKVLAVHKEFSKFVFGSAKEKIFGMDREDIALIMFEFIFSIIIAFAIYIYLDPTINIVSWPFNYIAFFMLVGFGIYIFSQTKIYRELNYDTPIIKRILPAERLIPLKRITNKKSGSTRIRSRKTHYKKK